MWWNFCRRWQKKKQTRWLSVVALGSQIMPANFVKQIQHLMLNARGRGMNFRDEWEGLWPSRNGTSAWDTEPLKKRRWIYRYAADRMYPRVVAFGMWLCKTEKKRKIDELSPSSEISLSFFLLLASLSLTLCGQKRRGLSPPNIMATTNTVCNYWAFWFTASVRLDVHLDASVLNT